MISLLLDTNILHQEGLISGNMQLLNRLVDASHVKIYVPEIVKREFLSRRVIETKEKLKEARNSLSVVGKKISKASDIQSENNRIQTSLKEMETVIEGVILRDFSQWEKNLSASILSFKPEFMTEVIDEYFSGGSVYRRPKCREDIPDAIINKSIDELIIQNEKITVAIKDGAFKKHLRKNPKITLVDSLEEFLNLETNRNKILELDARSEKTGGVIEFFRSNAFNALLHDFLTKSEDNIEEIYLEDDEISDNDELEVETFAQRINFPQADTVENLTIVDVNHLSSSSYSLKISFDATATLNYGANYSSYMYLEEDTHRQVSLDSMDGDGICDLSEFFKFTFYGHVGIEFGDDLDIDAIRAHSQYLGSKANPITAEIEIIKAEISSS